MDVLLELLVMVVVPSLSVVNVLVSLHLMVLVASSPSTAEAALLSSHVDDSGLLEASSSKVVVS